MRVFWADSLEWLFLERAEHCGCSPLLHGIVSLVCSWKSVIPTRYILPDLVKKQAGVRFGQLIDK